MQILVVGGAGYIGSIVVEELIKDKNVNKIIVLDDLSTGFKESIPSNIDFVLGSILDKNTLDKVFKENKIDLVIHLAAKTSVAESVLKPSEYWESNLYGTSNLLIYMKKYNVKKIIFSSTAAVYGEVKSVPINETDDTIPVNPYGSSKLACEKLICEENFISNIEYVIFRYFNVAGASEKNGLRLKKPTLLIPNINKSIIEETTFNLFGNDYDTFDGTNIRDYIHVKDIAQAHLNAIEWLSVEENKKAILNLGNQTGYSNMQIINKTEEVLNKKVNYEIKGRRKGDPSILITNNDLAKKTINWKATSNLDSMIISDYEFRKIKDK